MSEFPASENKLEKLRDNGLYPYSEAVVAFFVFLGFLASCYFVSNQHQLIDSIQKLFQGQKNLSFGKYILVFLIFLLPVTTGLFAHLAQLRFRLYNSFNYERSKKSNNLFVVIFSLFAFVLFYCLMFLFLIFNFDSVHTSQFLALRRDFNGNFKSTKYPFFHQDFLLSFVLSLLVFFFIYGAISFLLARFSFLRQHRMTKEEILAELRESETASLAKENFNN